MNRLVSILYLPATVLPAILLLGTPAAAQTGGSYDLRWSSIDGGGATFSSGGSYRLGGTIGQPDAGTLSGGVFVLSGGFWSVAVTGLPPTPTATKTMNPPGTLTPTSPAPPTATASTSPTPTRTGGTLPTPTSTVVNATSTPTGSPQTTPSATPSATPTPPVSCVGDCGLDGMVTVNELLVMVNVALDNAPVSSCEAGDKNQNGEITVDEILVAVNNALNECR